VRGTGRTAVVTETRTCRRQSCHVIVTCRMNRMFPTPGWRGAARYECVFSARMSARRGGRPVRSFMRSIFLGAAAEYEVERGLWPIYDSERALRTLLPDVDVSLALRRAIRDARVAGNFIQPYRPIRRIDLTISSILSRSRPSARRSDQSVRRILFLPSI